MTTQTTQNITNQANLIWSIADLLRGDYKQFEYADVILPLTVMRRLDCVLEPTQEQVRAAYLSNKDDFENLTPLLTRVSRNKFYNTSPFTFAKLVADPSNLALNLRHYIQEFSPNVRELFTEHFGFMTHIDRLDSADLLFRIMERFARVDLHPDAVSNLSMGYAFEELIRKFNEQSNETAGEHFTPREVIRLMVKLLISPDEQALKKGGQIRTIFDPTAGTGGMLTIAKEHILEHVTQNVEVRLFGQELNPKSFAICKSDLLIQAEDDKRIALGNSLTRDGHAGETFNFMLSNPPFGVEWKKVEKQVRDEAETLGMGGRFGAGLPRVSDGSLLFLQHLISKMKFDGSTSRIAIVLNGSPLFTGDAGSGESEIRRWILERDLLDALVALPDQLFYNTGISTYVWILDANKPPARAGKVQLINAASFSQKMRKSLGSKRNEVGPEQIEEIVRLYLENTPGEQVKVFDTTDFGYRKITVERPLRQNFQVTDERLERLSEKKALQKLSGQDQQSLVTALVTLGDEPYLDGQVFEKALNKALTAVRLRLKTPELKAVLEALSERDEAAMIVRDSKGQPLPDADLRDTENVPLGESIQAYFEREVKPYVPDAWINEDVKDTHDGQVGKVGYEISFTRYFYTYTPPRELEEIDAEIRVIEAEILDMLRELNI